VDYYLEVGATERSLRVRRREGERKRDDDDEEEEESVKEKGKKGGRSNNAFTEKYSKNGMVLIT
jgi:hypothetical protein